MPPLRTIGFNPQLITNDGLLVQSYMQAFNTDFPDATRRIEKRNVRGEVYKTNKASVSLSDTEASSENGDYLLSHCYAVPSA